MSKVNVEYDLAPAMVEGAIRNKLIEMGWTPPEPKQKVIDLSMMVGSDIDMEFGNSLNVNDLGFTTIDKLAEDNITKQGLYITKRQLKGFEQCRIRESHWHSFKGDECPLPEGLIATFRYIADDGCIEEARISQYREMNWSAVIAFKVLGTADDARYEWQKENKE